MQLDHKYVFALMPFGTRVLILSALAHLFEEKSFSFMTISRCPSSLLHNVLPERTWLTFATSQLHSCTDSGRQAGLLDSEAGRSSCMTDLVLSGLHSDASGPAGTPGGLSPYLSLSLSLSDSCLSFLQIRPWSYGRSVSEIRDQRATTWRMRMAGSGTPTPLHLCGWVPSVSIHYGSARETLPPVSFTVSFPPAIMRTKAVWNCTSR